MPPKRFLFWQVRIFLLVILLAILLAARPKNKPSRSRRFLCTEIATLPLEHNIRSRMGRFFGVTVLAFSTFCFTLASSPQTAQSAVFLGPTWAIDGAMITLPTNPDSLVPLSFDSILITELLPNESAGRATVGDILADGTFRAIEGVSFEFTAMKDQHALRITAQNQTYYILEDFRIFTVRSGGRGFAEFGRAALARRERTYRLRAADPNVDIGWGLGARVNSGPIGQAIVHGRFISANPPLNFHGYEASVLKFSDFTGYSQGRVEFGNLSSDGKFEPSPISTIWRYESGGVAIGGRKGVPFFEIKNGTSEINEPKSELRPLQIIERKTLYHVQNAPGVIVVKDRIRERPDPSRANANSANMDKCRSLFETASAL
jgi:hypothetical protein